MGKAKSVVTHTADELGEALGLDVVDTAEMEFRSELTTALIKAIERRKLTHAQLAERAGTSRTRVTAIANGNTRGISTDVLIRVLAAAGYSARLTVSRTPASRRRAAA